MKRRPSGRVVYLYSPVDSAVHRMLAAGFLEYARASNRQAEALDPGRSGLLRLASIRRSVIFVGSTGVLNLLAVPLARLGHNEVLYYLHEPSSLRLKVGRANGLLKSMVWHLVQWIDLRVATVVVVSREGLRARVGDVYGVSAWKVEVAPLLLPSPMTVTEPADRRRVTYIGRLDERRYLSDFLHNAPRFVQLGLKPTLLTSDPAASALNPSDAVELHVEADFSEERKAMVLAETRVVWNPKRHDISQSGVTADALRYGCRVLLSPQDPMYKRLIADGVALDYESEVETGFGQCAAPLAALVSRRASQLFSELHGPLAFANSYEAILDASARRAARRRGTPA